MVTRLLILCLLMISLNAYSMDQKFRWSPNAEKVDGYRLYAWRPEKGEVRGNSNQYVAVDGNTTNCTFTGLSTGHKYYFTLVAFFRYTGGIIGPESPDSYYVTINAPSAQVGGNVGGSIQ